MMSAVPGAVATRPQGFNANPTIPRGVLCRTHFAPEDRHAYVFYKDPHGQPHGQIRAYRVDTRNPKTRVLFHDLPASAQVVFLELCHVKDELELQWTEKMRKKLENKAAKAAQ